MTVQRSSNSVKNNLCGHVCLTRSLPLGAGSGQTGKTTAHVMLWNDDYYHMLEKTWGEDWMKKVGESHRESADFIENVIKEEGFDAGYTRTTGYLVANDEGVSF